MKDAEIEKAGFNFKHRSYVFLRMSFISQMRLFILICLYKDFFSDLYFVKI